MTKQTNTCPADLDEKKQPGQVGRSDGGRMAVGFCTFIVVFLTVTCKWLCFFVPLVLLGLMVQKGKGRFGPTADVLSVYGLINVF